MTRALAALSVPVLLVASALTTTATTAEAAPAPGPRHGATYQGKVTLTHGFSARVRFKVSDDGTSAARFAMPDGPPTASTCAEGPWGHPVSVHTPITGGKLAVEMTLYEDKDNPDLGTVEVSGHFARKGKFKGTVVTRTQADVCNATFHFTASAD